MSFYGNELTVEQAIEAWRQIDKDKISIEDLGWCAILDAKLEESSFPINFEIGSCEDKYPGECY